MATELEMAQQRAKEYLEAAAAEIERRAGVVFESNSGTAIIDPNTYDIVELASDKLIIPAPYDPDAVFLSWPAGSVRAPQPQAVGRGHKLLKWYGPGKTVGKPLALFDLATGLDFVLMYTAATFQGIEIVPSTTMLTLQTCLTDLVRNSDVRPGLLIRAQTGQGTVGVVNGEEVWYAASYVEEGAFPNTYISSASFEPAREVPKNQYRRPYGMLFTPRHINTNPKSKSYGNSVESGKYEPFGMNPHMYGQALRLRQSTVPDQDALDFVQKFGPLFGFQYDLFQREKFVGLALESGTFVHMQDFVVGAAAVPNIKLPDKGQGNTRPSPIRYGSAPATKLTSRPLLEADTPDEKDYQNKVYEAAPTSP